MDSESSNNKTFCLRVRPVYVVLMGCLLLAFFAGHLHYRLTYGSCVFRYVLPRCDYGSYVKASQEIQAGRSPYYEHTNYIYTPLLAYLMVPFSKFSEATGFSLWTVLNAAAFGYGAYRAGSLRRR